MMPNLQSFLTKFNRSEFEGFVLKCKRYTRNDVKQYYHIFVDKHKTLRSMTNLI